MGSRGSAPRPEHGGECDPVVRYRQFQSVYEQASILLVGNPDRYGDGEFARSSDPAVVPMCDTANGTTDLGDHPEDVFAEATRCPMARSPASFSEMERTSLISAWASSNLFFEAPGSSVAAPLYWFSGPAPGSAFSTFWTFFTF